MESAWNRTQHLIPKMESHGISAESNTTFNSKNGIKWNQNGIEHNLRRHFRTPIPPTSSTTMDCIHMKYELQTPTLSASTRGRVSGFGEGGFLIFEHPVVFKSRIWKKYK